MHYWPEFLVIKFVDVLKNERMLIARTLLAPTHCCVTPTLTLRLTNSVVDGGGSDTPPLQLLLLGAFRWLPQIAVLSGRYKVP